MGHLGTLFLHLCQMSAWRSIENLIIYIFLLTCLWRSRWQLDRKCSYSCLRRATLVYASWEFLHWQHTPVQRKEMTTIPRKRRSFVLSSTSLNAGCILVFLALSHLTWIMAQGKVLNWKFIDNSVEVILGENEAHRRFYLFCLKKKKFNHFSIGKCKGSRDKSKNTRVLLCKSLTVFYSNEMLKS